MSHALVIARRELAEKRFVFFAAIAFALLAVAMPLVPGLRSDGRDVIALTSVILTCAFTLGLAGILGASIVGRDLSAGRLSFYFARPVAPASIWFGKLAAAAALVIASFLIIILPAVIAAGWQVTRTTTLITLSFGSAVAVLALAFFFVAHALSTMIRSRSVLIGLDFVAAIVTGTVLWQLARPLLETLVALRALLTGFGVAALIVFVAAGAWQLADGRADRRRSHAAFSTALWSGLGVALLLAAGFVGWIVSASPRDLERVAGVQPSQRGDWVIVNGIARHRFDYRPTFLMNAATGEARRIDAAPDAIFSADGSKYLDLRPLSNPTCEVVIRDTASGRTDETRITVRPMTTRMVATGDLARLAVADGKTLTVYEVPTGRSLGSARLTDPLASMYFAAPDVVRFYTIDGRSWNAFEFDAARHTLQKTGTLTTLPLRFHATADGTRLATLENGMRSVVIRDPRTLQAIGGEDLAQQALTMAVLADGRIVTAELKDGHVVLRVIGTKTAVDLPPGRPWIVRDLGGGKVAVAFLARFPSLFVVDVDRGSIVRRENNLALPMPAFSADPRTAQWSPNMIVIRGGSVLRWHALTGETKVLVPG